MVAHEAGKDWCKKISTLPATASVRIVDVDVPDQAAGEPAVQELGDGRILAQANRPTVNHGADGGTADGLHHPDRLLDGGDKAGFLSRQRLDAVAHARCFGGRRDGRESVATSLDRVRVVTGMPLSQRTVDDLWPAKDCHRAKRRGR